MPLIEKIIWQIESHLARPLTLSQLARLCGVSKYHMTRSFQEATGLAPMAYLRARRLSQAAEALSKGNQDILTIALEAQYQSHEAFTRAFSQYFGELPSNVKRAKTAKGLVLMRKITMDQDLIVDIAPPRLIDQPEFQVIGLGVESSVQDTSNIPQLWQQLNALNTPEDWAKVTCTYGVCIDFDENGRFRYVAGLSPAEIDAQTRELEIITVPSGKYAVFTHKGHISEIGKSTYTVWNKALPDSGLTAIDGPNFERYDNRFDAQTGLGEVEIWIPVEL